MRPRNDNLLGMRGIAYQSLGNSDLALDDLSAAIQHKPAIYHYWVRSSIYRSAGDLDSAIADLNAAIIISPKNSTSYIERAKIYEQQGDFAQAVADFQTAIELFPNPEPYCHLAELHAKMGDWNAAQKTWNEGLESTFGDANIFFHRGKAYAQRGENDKAYLDFDYAAKAARKWDDRKAKAQFFFELALVYHEKLKDYDNALRYYKIAGNYDPSEPVNYLNRSWIYMQKRDFPTALAEIQQALDKKPSGENHAKILNNLGCLYAFWGDFDKAQMYLNQVIAVAPDYHAPHINYTAIHLKQNRFAEAIAAAETAFKLKSSEQGTLSALAVAHYAAGNVDKALELWRSLIEIEPNYNNLEWIKTEKIWFDWTLLYAEQIIDQLNHHSTTLD